MTLAIFRDKYDNGPLGYHHLIAVVAQARTSHYMGIQPHTAGDAVPLRWLDRLVAVGRFVSRLMAGAYALVFDVPRQVIFDVEEKAPLLDIL